MKRVIFTGFTLPDTTDTTYEVQEILNRRILEKTKNKKIIEKLEYFVKWRGWDSKHNKWVPWFDFNGVEMIRDFERKLQGEGPSYKLSRHDKDEWRPLPNHWKVELDRCHKLYLAKVKDSEIQESELQNPDPPLIEYAEDADIQSENHSHKKQGSIHGNNQTSGSTIQQNYDDGIERTQKSNTVVIQDRTVATLPSADDGNTPSIEGNRIVENSYIMVQNYNVHVLHVPDAKRKTETDGERWRKNARIASAGYHCNKSLTSARNTSLPTNCTDEHSFVTSSSSIVQPPRLARFRNHSGFSPAMSSADSFDSSQSGNALESLPRCTNFAQPFGFLSFGSPYLHALQPNALVPLQFYAPQELWSASLAASTVLNSAYYMNQTQSMATGLNTLGYIPRVRWNDGNGVVTVSRSYASWSARRERVENDESQ